MGEIVATSTIIAIVKVRWRLAYYIAVLELFCTVFDTDPDWSKLNRVIKSAVYVEIVSKVSIWA